MPWFAKKNNSAPLTRGSGRPDALNESPQGGDGTWETDDDGIESGALDQLESVVVPGRHLEVDVSSTNRILRLRECRLIGAGHHHLDWHLKALSKSIIANRMREFRNSLGGVR